MSYDIFCFIPGDRSTFSVSINETESVDNLRDKIKAKKSNELKHVDAAKLTLYRVEVDKSCDKKTRISELERLSQTLNECLELEDEERQLSEAFGESPPQGKKYYILVQVPKGESIHSRACGAVALMVDQDLPGCTALLYLADPSITRNLTNLDPRSPTLSTPFVP